MKVLMTLFILVGAPLAQAKVTCQMNLAGYANGTPAMTSTPLKIFEDSENITTLHVTSGDFFAEYDRVDQFDIERLSITYKSALILRAEAGVRFNKEGIAYLELKGDPKIRPDAEVVCKRN